MHTNWTLELTEEFLLEHSIPFDENDLYNDEEDQEKSLEVELEIEIENILVGNYAFDHEFGSTPNEYFLEEWKEVDIIIKGISVSPECLDLLSTELNNIEEYQYKVDANYFDSLEY